METSSHPNVPWAQSKAAACTILERWLVMEFCAVGSLQVLLGPTAHGLCGAATRARPASTVTLLQAGALQIAQAG